MLPLRLLQYFCFFALFMGNISAFEQTDIEAYLIKNNFQGAALVAKDGKILFQRGFGLANREHQISNDIHTVFRLASVTKQFTAISILQLYEKGMLLLTDPISKYLSDYPQGHKITIHHLLSHTSGIPSITKLSNITELQRRPTNVTQTLQHFQNLPLQFEPGTDANYSDSGYLVLGAIIEAITHNSYENYIRSHILKPLNMNSTYLDSGRNIIPFRAEGYERLPDGRIVHAAYLDMSLPYSAGSLLSTVGDLYKLDRALKECSLLKKETTALLFTQQSQSKKNQITYGYGFFVGPQNEELESARETIIGHYGTIEGFRASSYRYPDEDLVVILLSNLENTEINSLNIAVAEIARSRWRWQS